MKKVIFPLLLAAAIFSVESCKKRDHPVTYYTANFKIEGTSYQYQTTSTFGRLCLLSGNCNNFYADPVGMQGSYLMIGLPGNVKAGMDIKPGDGNWQIVFFDKNGHGYYSSTYDSVNIHIDVWEGHGGWGKGTFSAKLRYSAADPAANDSLTITDGTFSSRIWYYTR